jgi:hypothetical protein
VSRVFFSAICPFLGGARQLRAKVGMAPLVGAVACGRLLEARLPGEETRAFALPSRATAVPGSPVRGRARATSATVVTSSLSAGASPVADGERAGSAGANSWRSWRQRCQRVDGSATG